MDFGEADDVLGPVGLIPTNRGIPSTAGRSTRLEARDKGRHRSCSEASSLSARSSGSGGGKSGHDDDSDEFVDANEA